MEKTAYLGFQMIDLVLKFGDPWVAHYAKRYWVIVKDDGRWRGRFYGGLVCQFWE
jgi:hypothetical protein